MANRAFPARRGRAGIGRRLAGVLAAASLLLATPLAAAPGAEPVRAAYTPPASAVPATAETYSSDEVLDAGHAFFGQVSGNLAAVLERAFAGLGEPVGYILGEEGSGAFFGGLRYGEGVLHTRSFGTRRVYWQGPSFGWDFGGDGARVMMLVYQLPDLATLFQRFTGVNGSAYLVGGLGMTLLAADTTYIVPVRAGVGARLGVNIGYVKFTERPTWNPF